ncbi:alpha/beta fold hydrolase [Sporosarcina gallistercoris]|uniref:Lysophospholipase n=1 Tax=Sporosarcina gallistercoris TaxID=2762245 RepID=A0ABR8PFX8_9BACL|nr:alpha/beta hydrolase [Sporosarcina gallistercoris]MBD7907053.1 lysophospholipase [Sporosarcina gallistercoris]
MDEQLLTMSDGAILDTYTLKPSGTPRGHMFLVHGMAEHIGRYELVMNELAQAGYVVTGFNQRGHGPRAQDYDQLGDFGDGVTFDRLVEDVLEVMDALKVENPDLPRILFGHSMGSFVVRRFSQKYGAEIDALICSGTAGKPGLTRVGGSLLASILSIKDGPDAPSDLLDSIGFGGYNKKVANPETKFDWLSTDRQTVHDYIEDPLSGAVSTNRFFYVLFDGLKRISTTSAYGSVPNKLPILLFAGTEDPVGNMGSGIFEAAKMYTDAGVENVTVHLLEGVRHEALQGPSREPVLNMMKQWVEKL